jgi:hypothetical protein
MFKYYLGRISSTLASLAIGVCGVLVIESVFLLALFQSPAFVNKTVNAQKATVITAVDEALEAASTQLGLEKDAMTGAVNDSNVGTLTSILANAMRSGKAADFSSNADLYNILAQKLAQYKKSSLTPAEINRCASWGVECVNAAIGGKTASGSMLNFVYSKLVLYVIIAGVVLIAASIAVIEIFNNGRHRRFNYLGMGLTTCGLLLILVPLYERFKNMLAEVSFSDFALYDYAAKSILSFSVKFSLAAGAVIYLAGFIMLVLNYRYFRRRNLEIKERREKRVNENDTYLEPELPASNTKGRNENGEFEREVMKIDFDE